MPDLFSPPLGEKGGEPAKPKRRDMKKEPRGRKVT